MELKEITLIPKPLFDKETHTYKIEGKEVPSVTQILQRQGISPDYSFVKKSVLEASAKKGTMIHKEIEEYNKTGEVGFTPELSQYTDFIEMKNLKPVLSEVMVWCEDFAGTFDELLQDESGKYWLADNKITSQFHTDSVAWQLSLYAYATKKVYGIEVAGIIGLHFKNGKLSVHELAMKSDDEIMAMLEADREGRRYCESYPIDENIISEIEYLKVEQKRIEDRIAELSEQIILAMQEKGSYKFDTGYATFSLVTRKGRETFDSKKFREDHKDMNFDDYMKTSADSITLQIKIKGENKL